MVSLNFSKLSSYYGFNGIWRHRRHVWVALLFDLFLIAFLFFICFLVLLLFCVLLLKSILCNLFNILYFTLFIFRGVDRMMNNMVRNMFGSMPDPFDMMDNMLMRHNMGQAIAHHRMPQMRPSNLLGGPHFAPLMMRNNSGYSYSSVMTMSTGPNGRPLVYEATSSSRYGPDGVQETRSTVHDSASGTFFIFFFNLNIITFLHLCSFVSI